MFIRVASDVHFECISPMDYGEHFDYCFPELPTDKDSILILAGDCFRFSTPSTYMDVLRKLAPRFAEIFFLAGNHEYYFSNIYAADDHFKQFVGTECPNVTYFDKKTRFVKRGDILFVCATLWTDYNKNDPHAKILATNYMTDFQYIRGENRTRITPEDIYKLHKADLASIKKAVKNNEFSKLVIITHHFPSMQCVHPKYRNEGLSNYLFGSDLDKVVDDLNADIWISGHTHESIRTKVFDTEVIINPCGYLFRQGYENVNFDRKLVIDINAAQPDTSA